MPFDCMPSGSGLDRLRALRDRLRQALPENFTWDYSFIRRKNACGTAGCALGLAMETMPDFDAFINLGPNGERSAYDGGVWFGISLEQFIYVFLYAPAGTKVADITPDQVADRIDTVLWEHELTELTEEMRRVCGSGERHLGGLVPA